MNETINQTIANVSQIADSGWKLYLKNIGDWTSSISGNIIKQLSEKGMNANTLTMKIITIAVLSLLAFLSLKIGKKVVKYALFTLLFGLALSILFSMFN